MCGRHRHHAEHERQSRDLCESFEHDRLPDYLESARGMPGTPLEKGVISFTARAVGARLTPIQDRRR
jgi:hypothetical protein